MWDEHLFLTRQRRKQRGVEFEHVRRPWTRFLLGDRKLMRDHPGQQCELEALFQLPLEPALQGRHTVAVGTAPGRLTRKPTHPERRYAVKPSSSSLSSCPAKARRASGSRSGQPRRAFGLAVRFLRVAPVSPAGWPSATLIARVMARGVRFHAPMYPRLYRLRKNS
jgi:hypothetical protein